MFKTIIKTATVCLGIAMLATACKKDETPAKTYYLSALADSSGTDLATFEYDSDNKLIRFGEGSSSGYNFFYSGSKLIVRNYTSAGSVSSVDSFFYDASNKLVRVEGYNGMNVKQKTVTLAYNGDNTLNSGTVDYTDPLTNDLLLEYTYSGGNISKRKTSEKVLGVYKTKNELEFLGLDDKTNPFYSIYTNYLLDQFNLFYFVWSGQHNPTSGKQTDYDTNTGNVTSVASATSVYEYNADGMPTKATHSQGASTNIYTFKYTTK